MHRQARVHRKTGETEVTAEVVLDGQGRYSVDVASGMLKHLLELLSRHSLIDITLSAQGETASGYHHLVEDLAIVLGRALSEALGERRGIGRMGHAIVPMDEALALVAVDLGGRGYAVVEADFTADEIGDLPSDMVRHFVESLANEGRMNIHARLLAGANDHHRAEAIVKALARSLRDAVREDTALAGESPTTKGTIG